MATRTRRRVGAETPDQDLAALGGTVGQDPEPAARPTTRAGRATRAGTRAKTSARSATGKVMSRQAMIDKVSTEIYMYLSLFVAAAELAEETRGVPDPCAAVAFEVITIPTPDGPRNIERLSGITERITAMIARDDKLLARVAKSGILGDIAVMAHLAWPIARKIWSHHGPFGDGHNMRGSDDRSANDAQLYPTYQGANG